MTSFALIFKRISMFECCVFFFRNAADGSLMDADASAER